MSTSTSALKRSVGLQIRRSFGGKMTGRSAVVVVGRFKYRNLLTYRELRIGLSRYELQFSKVAEILKPSEKPQ